MDGSQRTGGMTKVCQWAQSFAVLSQNETTRID